MSAHRKEKAENPEVSYQDSEYIRQIAFAVADECLHRGTHQHKRSVDLARTLLTECHRRCRPLDLAAMRRAPVSMMREDLTTLRQQFNLGTYTLPEQAHLNFAAKPKKVAA